MMSEHGNQRDLGDSLKSLGIPTGEIRRVETISVRPGHRLYRIRSHRRSYVLKSFPVRNPGNEIRSYGLLRRLGVPTIKVLGQTKSDLLLEDLTCSDTWRLATEMDVCDRHVGAAVAMNGQADLGRGHAGNHPADIPGRIFRIKKAV